MKLKNVKKYLGTRSYHSNLYGYPKAKQIDEVALNALHQLMQGRLPNFSPLYLSKITERTYDLAMHKAIKQFYKVVIK